MPPSFVFLVCVCKNIAFSETFIPGEITNETNMKRNNSRKNQKRVQTILMKPMNGQRWKYYGTLSCR
jgi:hypothetical protein